LDAASAPKARLWIQGKTPKTKIAHKHLPQGVFSETSDYIEGAKARLEIFSLMYMRRYNARFKYHLRTKAPPEFL
jgi:hypothetical protein